MALGQHQSVACPSTPRRRARSPPRLTWTVATCKMDRDGHSVKVILSPYLLASILDSCDYFGGPCRCVSSNCTQAGSGASRGATAQREHLNMSHLIFPSSAAGYIFFAGPIMKRLNFLLTWPYKIITACARQILIFLLDIDITSLWTSWTSLIFEPPCPHLHPRSSHMYIVPYETPISNFPMSWTYQRS